LILIVFPYVLLALLAFHPNAITKHLSWFFLFLPNQNTQAFLEVKDILILFLNPWDKNIKYFKTHPPEF